MQVPPEGLVRGEDGRARCWWCDGDPLYRDYHDDEWGRPTADDRRLFEKICLEGFQSGLSWLIILRKRENFRRAFAGFDAETVARFGDGDIDRLVTDAGIVRHRGKIASAINNARRYLELVEEFGSLAAFVWSFEPHPGARPSTLTWSELAAQPPLPEAVRLSKELKRRGWSFVGPTTVYAMMEAAGLVNDHVTGCDVRDEVERARRSFRRPARA